MALVKLLPEIKGGYVLLKAGGELTLAMDQNRGWIISSVGQFYTTQLNYDQLGVNRANCSQFDIIAVFDCTTTPLNEVLDLESYRTRKPIWVKQTLGVTQ